MRCPASWKSGRYRVQCEVEMRAIKEYEGRITMRCDQHGTYREALAWWRGPGGREESA